MTWDESKHPRDDEGKFTYSGGSSNTSTKESYEDKMQKRADILYPTMQDKKINNNQPDYKNIGLGNISNDKNMTREDILYPTMRNKNEMYTGGAASIVTNEIAGVKKGEQKTLEDAIRGVNPDYSAFGNITHKTNCQAGVIVAEARVRGFDIEVSIDYESEIKDKLSQRPNIAYIDPKTGRTPEFTKMNVNNEFECERGLDNIVKQGERYILAFQWKQKISNGKNIAHVVILTKETDNKLKIYDPQNRVKYENIKILLNKIQYQFSMWEDKNPPKILRTDDKELNYKIVNQISTPARKK